MFDISAEAALFYGFIALCLIGVLTVIGLIYHSGFFSEIIISTCKPYIREITVAYKFARGPYKESGALFTEAHTLLPQYRTIGVYYDDPRKKEASHLRYVVGLIISEGGSEINKEDEVLLKERGFSFVSFPQIYHSVQTTFPFNSTISIIVAIFKVYPLLNYYIESRSLCAHPFIEIYDAESCKIYFIAPLEKQDDFYVREVKLENEYKLNEDEDDKSSISWDDSASIIRNDAVDVDSESIGDESVSASHVTNSTLACSILDKEEGIPTDPNSPIDLHIAFMASIKEVEPAIGDDSDINSTGSSFEEIDEKEAPEESLLENKQAVPVIVTTELKSEL